MRTPSICLGQLVRNTISQSESNLPNKLKNNEKINGKTNHKKQGETGQTNTGNLMPKFKSQKKKKKKPLTPRNQKPPLYVRVINRHWYEQTKGINDWILAGVQGMGSRYKPKKKKKRKSVF